MNKTDYWQLFLETGAPEVYLLYAKQLKMEENHVPDRPGHCTENNGIQ